MNLCVSMCVCLCVSLLHISQPIALSKADRPCDYTVIMDWRAHTYVCALMTGQSTIPASPGPAHGAGRSKQGRVHVGFTISHCTRALSRNNIRRADSTRSTREKRGREP